MTTDYKIELQTLVDALIESDAAREIDAGCDGFGPVANALIALGKTYEEANLLVWGDDADEVLDMDSMEQDE